MPHKELDTLRRFTATMNNALSNRSQPEIFSDFLIQNELLAQSVARNIISPTGHSAYHKMSQMNAAVYSYIQTVGSPERATELFHKLISIFYYDLELTDLAKDMVKNRS